MLFIKAVLDRMSKMVHMIATTTNVNAQGVTQLFQNKVVCLQVYFGSYMGTR